MSDVERPGVAEKLLEAVRNGIDAARYFARHEAVAGMTSDDQALVDLANAVEEAAAELDDTMMSLLDHQGRELDNFDEQTN